MLTFEIITINKRLKFEIVIGRAHLWEYTNKRMRNFEILTSTDALLSDCNDRKHLRIEVTAIIECQIDDSSNRTMLKSGIHRTKDNSNSRQLQ